MMFNVLVLGIPGQNVNSNSNVDLLIHQHVA
jgi:hypothetical protein